MDLDLITERFGESHSAKKKVESTLKKLKDEFYEAATEEMAQRDLAQKIVDVPVGEEQVDNWVSQWHPGWVVIEEIEEGRYVIGEDPAQTKFVYVNPNDGLKYERNIIQGAPSLDDERLRENDPDLWQRVSEPSEIYAILQEFAVWARGDIVKPLVQTFLKSKDIPRVLKPLETLDDKDLSALSDYLVPGPLSLRMETPRKVKDDG